MTTRRRQPYVWVTWLARLMAGDVTCEWAPWFKSHYSKYEKMPADFTVWRIRHTRLLRQLRLAVSAPSSDLLTERQVHFKHRRASGLVIAGRPDLVSIRDGRATAYDAKTGQPRASDKVQVMLYVHYLPRADARFSELEIDGEVVYPDHRVTVRQDEVGKEFEDNLDYFLDILEAGSPPVKTPSAGECRFCDIAKSACPDRVDVAACAAASS